MSDSLVGMESCDARSSRGPLLAHWQITTDLTVLRSDAIDEFTSANELEEDDVTDYVFLHELDHRFFFHTVPLQTVFHLNAEACAFLVKYSRRITKASKVEFLQKSIKRRSNHQDVVPLLEAEALFNAEVTPRYQKVARLLLPASGPILKTLRRLRRLYRWSGSKDLARLSVYMAMQGVGAVDPRARRPIAMSRSECFERVYGALEEIEEAEGLEGLLPQSADPAELAPATGRLTKQVTERTGIRFIRMDPGPSLQFLWSAVHKRRPGMERMGRPESSAMVVRWSDSNPTQRRLSFRPDLTREERNACAGHLVATHLADQVLSHREPACYLGQHGLCGQACPRPCNPLLDDARRFKVGFNGINAGRVEKEWESFGTKT